MILKTFISFLLLILSLQYGSAQLSDTGNTVQLEPGQLSPPATLTDVAWIAGHWHGEAFGGITEEIWSPPSGGSMMCAFKMINKDEIMFYEICTITEEEGSLILRLKHFHPDLKGWEEKDETVDFPLVRFKDNKVFFSGFTFERISENEMNIHVLVSHEPGKEEEIKFSYRKKETWR